MQLGPRVPILDIRSTPELGSLDKSIRASMNPPAGQPKSLSTLLLYDGIRGASLEDQY
jgi:hypothetical protein